MSLLKAAHTTFTADGTKARLIAVPEGATVTVFNTGSTLYYDNASTVTSSSNDGNIASGASESFTSPKYVITAQNASTEVFVDQPATMNVRGSVTSGNYLSGTTAPKSGNASLGATGAGYASAGALYVNTTNNSVFVNEGSRAVPYWTPVSFTQPGVLGLYEDFRRLPSAILGGNVPAITDTGTVGWTPEGARVVGLGLAETDSGLAQGTNVEGSQVARLTATAAADARGIGFAGPSVAQFQPDTHGVIAIDVEFTNVSAITARDTFIGFVGVFADNAAPPVTGATTTATFGVDDLAGIFQSTIFTDGDGLMLVSEKGNAGGTQVSLTAAAALDAAGTYARYRVEVHPDGNAVAFKDKAVLGKIPGVADANLHSADETALDADEEIIPLFMVGTTTTTAVSVDVKRFAYWGSR